MNKIELGTITKPQGLKGEFRLKPALNNYDILNDINEVYINDLAYKVKKLTLRDGFVIYKLEGIDTCERAESLRNNKVYFEEIEKHNLPDDEYYVSDLIGLDIINEKGENLGKLIEINQFGSADVFNVKNSDQEFMFPFARNVIVGVDYNKKTITVNQKILDEIRV